MAWLASFRIFASGAGKGRPAPLISILSDILGDVKSLLAFNKLHRDLTTGCAFEAAFVVVNGCLFGLCCPNLSATGRELPAGQIRSAELVAPVDHSEHADCLLWP